MVIEHRLEASLIGLQRAGHHSDLLETIAIHLDQSQDFTTNRRQLLFNPDYVRDGDLHLIDCCGLFPTPVLMRICQWEKMPFEKFAGKVKGRAVLQRKVPA